VIQLDPNCRFLAWACFNNFVLAPHSHLFSRRSRHRLFSDLPGGNTTDGRRRVFLG